MTGRGNKRRTAARAETTGYSACFSSCRRFAAERVACGQRSRVREPRRCAPNDSISAIVCSVSILLHHLVRTHNRSNESGISDVTARLVDRDGSRHAQTLERGASRSSTDVRHNDQFENPDIGELNSIFFDLAYCVRWAEIPLLAHDFSKRAPAIWRPSQHELLGTLCLAFFEDERDASESFAAYRRLAEWFERQKRRHASPAFLLRLAQSSTGYSFSSDVTSTTAALSRSSQPSSNDGRIPSGVGVKTALAHTEQFYSRRCSECSAEGNKPSSPARHPRCSTDRSQNEQKEWARRPHPSQAFRRQ